MEEYSFLWWAGLGLAALLGIACSLFGKPKEPVKSFRDIAEKERPEAPCGEQYDHYRWTEIEGFRCPHCSRIEQQKKEAAKEDRMAELIATKIAAKLQ